MPLLPGQFILNGKYRILRLIRRGCRSTRWLAEEPRFLAIRQVAIKELRSLAADRQRGPEEQERRFFQEVRLAALLEQARASYVVRAITVEEMEDGARLLVMAYADSGSLADLIKTHPQGLPIDQAVHIAIQVCEALEVFHNLPGEPVHRDVKPSNILLTNKARHCLATLAWLNWWGRVVDCSLAVHSIPARPCIWRQNKSEPVATWQRAADVYALGCVFWEMLTGQHFKRHELRRHPVGCGPTHRLG